MTNAVLTIDRDADAAYLRLGDGAVASTVNVSRGVLVDLDEFNVAVGIEVLELDVEIPFDQLVREYHIPSSTVDVLRAVSPLVTTFEARIATRDAKTNSSGATRGLLQPC
ncbi:MAG: DUF2283 domain-containing protein [Brooklawnia sp.]|uniref:DUF2283 domain-containing protein n=1 Tax=Brooklawnia sp. TaxID=2699740 RepID=UPI003C70B2F2